MALWLMLFSLAGILSGFIQEKFPESTLIYYLSMALCFGTWLVFAYYCIQFNKTNKFITLFEIKFRK